MGGSIGKQAMFFSGNGTVNCKSRLRSYKTVFRLVSDDLESRRHRRTGCSPLDGAVVVIRR